MYYDNRLLSISNGRFGVVWFLGCYNRRSLSRKQIESVKVRQTCKEMEELLPISNHHASLHTLMTLQLGVVICLDLQVDFLIRDIDGCRCRAKEINLSVIDLPKIDEIPEGLMVMSNYKTIATIEKKLLKFNELFFNFENVEDVLKKAPKRLFTCPSKAITLSNEDDLNFKALEIFDPGFGQTEAFAAEDGLSIMSGDIFSDLPENLRTAENIYESCPEMPGAPARRKFGGESDDDVTFKDTDKVTEQTLLKRPRRITSDFEEETKAPENLILSPGHVEDDGAPYIPALQSPPIYENENLVEMVPPEIEMLEQDDIREQNLIEEIPPPPLVQEEQLEVDPSIPENEPPVSRRPRKRMKIDKVYRISNDQILQNMGNLETNKSDLFKRPIPRTISVEEILRKPGRSYLQNEFQRDFYIGVDDIELPTEDEDEMVRDVSQNDHNIQHSDLLGPELHSRSEVEMDFEAEIHIAQDVTSVFQPEHEISVGQFGPPVLDTSKKSQEIFPQSTQSDETILQSDVDEDPHLLSPSMVTERLVATLTETNLKDVSFQNILIESCSSRRQASLFFAGLLNAVALMKIEAYQASFYEDIFIRLGN